MILIRSLLYEMILVYIKYKKELNHSSAARQMKLYIHW